MFVLQVVSNNQRDATPSVQFWDPLRLPKHFDAREKWPMCQSIGRIYDQGNCKSSYAIAVAAVVSDRICIHSQGAETPSISAQQIVSCCYLCGGGCDGGIHEEAWYFYNRHGLVTGGYNSKEVQTHVFQKSRRFKKCVKENKNDFYFNH